MAETTLETLSLLMYLWFPQFEQKSTRIVKTWKTLLQAIDAADTTIAIFTTTFSIANVCYFYNYNAVFTIVSIV